MNNFFYSILFVLLLSGCAKTLQVDDNSIAEELNMSAFDFDYLSAKNKLRYDDGRTSISLSVNTRIRKDSVIWMSISPGFGFEAARVLATMDSVYIMDRINKDYTIYDYNTLSRQYKFDMTYNMIQSLLTGNMPVKISSQDRIEKNGDHFLVRQITPEFQVENKIDNTLLKLSSLIVRDKAGNKLDLQFSDFQLINDRYFPYHADVNVTGPDASTDGTSVTVDYSKVELSDSKLSFPFDVPQRYK